VSSQNIAVNIYARTCGIVLSKLYNVAQCTFEMWHQYFGIVVCFAK